MLVCFEFDFNTLSDALSVFQFPLLFCCVLKIKYRRQRIELTLIDRILYKIKDGTVLSMAPQCLQTRVLDQYHTHVVSVHAARDRL